MNENAVTLNQLVAELSKSPHGALSEYIPAGLRGASQHSEFYAHLIAYNEKRGQIRDSKVALPVISLSCREYPEDFIANSLAHLALLSPRDLLRGFRFAMTIKTPGRMSAIKRMVSRYLKARERNWAWFERTALQHRASLRELYALTHTRRNMITVGAILFGGEGSKRHPIGLSGFVPMDYPRGSVFEVVAGLKDMAPAEAAGCILERNIPAMIAMGALGAKAKEPELVLALIKRMTPTELVTNTKMLEKFGVRTNPALRGAFEAALLKAGASSKATFKTQRALESMEDDNPIREKLRGLQEKQIKAISGVEGDWLVLADKSGSMQHAIEAARRISATMAKMVKGAVGLIFFDTAPRYIDVTGKDYDAVLQATRHITANGGTSIGCALYYALENKIMVDGIVIVSDGAENQYPQFAAVYEAYSKLVDKKVPVYFYQLAGTDKLEHTAVFLANCRTAGADPQVFDLREQKVDFYSLPNLVQTMKVLKYSLVDEIMVTPLLDLDTALPVRGSAGA